MRSRVTFGVAASLVLAASGGAAQEASGPESWLSANVALTSDYAFRGITQSLGDGAVQGGIDLKHPSGLYLGTWGSSVSFGEDLAGGARASTEMDVYGGFGLALGDLASLDLGAIYYAYPGAAGARNYDFLELGVGASRSFGSLGTGVSVKYSPDFFAGSGSATYYGANVSLPVSRFTLSGTLGRQTIEENATFGTPDYTHWGAGAAVGVAGFNLGGQLIGTSLSEAECFGGSEFCDTRAVLSVSRAM